MWFRMTATATPESMSAYAAVQLEPTIPKVEPGRGGVLPSRAGLQPSIGVASGIAEPVDLGNYVVGRRPHLLGSISNCGLQPLFTTVP